MEAGTGYLVMASHLPLKRITATVRFFRAVSAVRKQLATADGLIGYTVRARPLARHYWTLSVWTDNTALREFMRTLPHIQLMTSLKPVMGPTTFVTWTISAADGRPSMAGALTTWPPDSVCAFSRSPLVIPARSGPFPGRPWLPISEPEPPVLRATLIARTRSH